MQTYNDELTVRLAERHEVTVVTATGQFPRSTAVTHHQCEGLRSMPDDQSWQIVRERVRAIAASAEPELIHLGEAQMAAYRDVLPPGVPVVASVHGNDLTKPWIELGSADPIAAIGTGLSACQRVLAVSQHTANLVGESGVTTPIEVVHNSCDLELFRPMEFDRKEFLSEFGVPADVPLILTIGRFAPRKGQTTVLRALAGLHVPFHWLVIGGKRTSRRLKLARSAYRMSRRMTVSAWLDPDDLVRVYNACDLFVLTPIERRRRSRIDSEGFGLVLHEAGHRQPARRRCAPAGPGACGAGTRHRHRRLGCCRSPVRWDLRRVYCGGPHGLTGLCGGSSECPTMFSGRWPAS
jgi:glycosyltransferase involved in cell wall biosynthesis